VLIFRGLGNVYTFQRRRFEAGGSERNVKHLAIMEGIIANFMTDQITTLASGLELEQFTG
jgi:hypothetical protein